MDEKKKELLDYANKLIDASISCTFTKPDKSTIGKWKTLQERLITKDELRKKAERGDVKGVAVITGKVSGGLEFLDFDKKLGKTVYPEWKEALKSQKPELLEKLITDASPSGGYHVGYRYKSESYDRGQTLAEKWEIDPETKEVRKNRNGTKRKVALVELKAEGCLMTCPPTPEYKRLQGDLLELPVISKEDRDFLISIAKSFHTAIAEEKVVSDTARQKKSHNGRLRPGDDFNQRGDWKKDLESDGWEKVFVSNGKEHWKHSNASNIASANFDPAQGDNGLLYVHSSNASPFEENTAYDPFAIHAFIKHDKDFKQATRELAKEGFGEKSDEKKQTTSETDGMGESGLLPVIINGKQMREVIVEMKAAISVYSDKPRIFQKSGQLVHVKFIDGRATIQKFDGETLKITLNHYADFFKEYYTEEGPEWTPTTPPSYLTTAILKSPRHDFPRLDFISHSPLFDRTGTLCSKPGYNEEINAHLHLDDNLSIDESDIEPTGANVAKAKALIDEILEGFPFEDDASKHNAIALWLTPFARKMVDSEIPLFAVDSSSPGSGKGLLVDALMMPYIGHRPISNSEVEGDEFRKQITTLLETSPDLIYFDNAEKLNSSALASALTKPYWQDRRLGVNEVSLSVNRAIWIINGNNLDISPENTRRVCWIRITPQTEDPEAREFKIKNLRKWVEKNRRELVIAALILVKNWIKQGMKHGNVRMGSFEQWAGIIGGIMECNGYTRFMGNVPELKSYADSSRDTMRAFVARWYETHSTDAVTVKDLFDIASAESEKDTSGSWEEVGEGILSELLTATGKRGRKMQLGKILKKNTDKTYSVGEGECQIRRRKERKDGFVTYCLRKIPKVTTTEESSCNTSITLPITLVEEARKTSNSNISKDKSVISVISVIDSQDKKSTLEGTVEEIVADEEKKGDDTLSFFETSSKQPPEKSDEEEQQHLLLSSGHGESKNHSTYNTHNTFSADGVTITGPKLSAIGSAMEVLKPEGGLDGKEAVLLAGLYDEFQYGEFPTQEMIRACQEAGFDVSEGNLSPANNANRIASRIAGKEIDGLKLKSISDGVYRVEVCEITGLL